MSEPAASVTTPAIAPAAAAPQAQSIFRPEVLAAYQAAPRGTQNRSFDPEDLQPRWAAAVVAACVLTALVVCGLLVSVPLRYAGTVISTAEHTIFVAVTGAEDVRLGDAVQVAINDTTVAGTVLQIKVAPDEASGYRMFAIESKRGGLSAIFPPGEQITVQDGTKPVLLDMLQR